MLILLSPAKNLDENPMAAPAGSTQPALLGQSEILMRVLQQKSPQELAALMHISDKLALLNAERNQNWQPPFTPENAKAAVYLFNGDVYEGLNAATLDAAATAYLQNHVRILSGLYGILRPLDLIQPYRLEMGIPLANPRGNNLYTFWGSLITDALNAEAGGRTVINLASQEYFKAVQPEKLAARIVSPVFKDRKNGTYKTISFYAKRARGLMARYAAEHRIETPEDLQQFDCEGYRFSPAASSENEWVFLREENSAA